MNVLLLGSTGMLGREVEAIFSRAAGPVSVSLFTTSRSPSQTSTQHRIVDLEYADFDSLLSWSKADVVIHPAALTSIDECEKNHNRADRVNVDSVAGLLASIEKLNPKAKLIYISSDAVKAEGQPMASESCRVAPLNYYGQTKLRAEEIISKSRMSATAIRTTIVGTRLGIGQTSLADWIVSSIRSGQKTKLFTDALFTPISAEALAKVLFALQSADLPKLLHVGGAQSVSKYEFGLKLTQALDLDTQLIEKSTISAAGLVASRLLDQTLSSKLAHEKFNVHAPTLEETVADVKQSIQKYSKGVL